MEVKKILKNGLLPKAIFIVYEAWRLVVHLDGDVNSGDNDESDDCDGNGYKRKNKQKIVIIKQ